MGKIQIYQNSVLFMLITFRLINVGEGKQNENGVTVLGKLNLTDGANNCSDKLLQIKVIPQAPCLQASFVFYDFYNIVFLPKIGK